MSAGTTSNWSKAAVLEQLGRVMEADRGLQVFLDRAVPGPEVEALARDIVARASERGEASMGPVSRLAKSFAVKGDMKALRAVSEDPRVHSVLPTSASDILPKPIPGDG